MSGDVRLQDQSTWHYDLGVLFVHSTGEQRQNTILARFGGSLQRWLIQEAAGHASQTRLPARRGTDGIAPEPVVEIAAMEHHTANGDDPAYARLLVGDPLSHGTPGGAGCLRRDRRRPRSRRHLQGTVEVLPGRAERQATAADPPPATGRVGVG